MKTYGARYYIELLPTVVPMTGSGLADAVVANHSGLQQPPTSMNAAAAAAAAVQLQAVSNNVASPNNSTALL